MKTFLRIASCLFIAGTLGAVTPEAVPDDAILKRYQLDPEYVLWQKTLYQDKDFKKVEDHAAALLRAGDDKSHFKLTNLIGILVSESRKSPGTIDAVLREWTTKHPDSSFGYIVRGVFLINYAWMARGSGWAHTIQKANRQLFLDRMQLAHRSLKKAYDLDPKNPNASVFLMEVLMITGAPREQLEEQFQNAVRIYPGHFTAHWKKMTYLQAKWGGSDQELLAFAEEMKKKAEYPRLAFVWAGAQTELHWRSKDPDSTTPDPFQKIEVWDEINTMYQRRFKSEPDNLASRANFGHYAYLFGRNETAAEQFDVIGDRWPAESSWGDVASYNASRAQVYHLVGWAYDQRGDYATAKEWYKRGIALGSNSSMCNLGWNYVKGRGLPQNNAEGMKWLQLSAAKGNSQAMNNLGTLYETGQGGVPQNIQMAATWYQQAAEKGNKQGKENLEALRKKGLVK